MSLSFTTKRQDRHSVVLRSNRTGRLRCCVRRTISRTGYHFQIILWSPANGHLSAGNIASTVRGLARACKTSCRDQLDRFLVHSPGIKSDHLAFLSGPERAAAITISCLLVDDRFDIDAAGRGTLEVVSGVARVVVSRPPSQVSRSVQNVGDVFVFVFSRCSSDFLLDLLYLFDEFEGDFFETACPRSRQSSRESSPRALVIEKAFGKSVGDSFPPGCR